MATFTIQTVPGALFATAPAIPGGPIQFIAQNNFPNQQWVLTPAGLTQIENVDFPGPGFASVVGPGVVDELVNVGPAPRNWFIAAAGGGSTIRLADAEPFLFWALNDDDEAILVAAPAAIFNIVPVPFPG
ncbi:GPI-anchored small secreted protein [Laccaria bicolor S238N-H82]|uniref:GPI-anchored small secreted protein n=1 Tax=Laccaria bicolor (strain S238N-H82 / ATCC MYA-4686) TaxID=486041 RepID=B0DX88_LACBS|nr:GPI-anchored small secreted protein [Laccaria bicolor S238N-H82]EDR00749.1 GPI-anchored small secreted protein [Laccaria bicolor S238N-H82]|eukprot:XP_001888541.1 GPI-anchored small secreted protein [Laccaria bicolor S238N-H82]